MRTLNPNEKRLAFAFGIVALLLLNLVIMRWLSGELHASRTRLSELRGEIGGLRALAMERPFWEVRAAWLESNRPPVHDGSASDSEFAERVQRETRQFNLTIENQQLLGSELVGEWVATPIDLTLRGGLESIVRWLQFVQGPGKFVSVETFNLRQSEDGSAMILRIRLKQLSVSARQSGGSA